MTMLHNSKKLFFQNLNPLKNKQFWKAMKYLHKQYSSIPNISYNNVVSTMDQEKANTCSMTTSLSISMLTLLIACVLL